MPISDVPYEGGKSEFTVGVPIEVDTPTGLDIITKVLLLIIQIQLPVTKIIYDSQRFVFK